MKVTEGRDLFHENWSYFQRKFDCDKRGHNQRIDYLLIKMSLRFLITLIYVYYCSRILMRRVSDSSDFFDFVLDLEICVIS